MVALLISPYFDLLYERRVIAKGKACTNAKFIQFNSKLSFLSQTGQIVIFLDRQTKNEKKTKEFYDKMQQTEKSIFNSQSNPAAIYFR